MSSCFWIRLGAVFAGIAVATGAFAAHYLESVEPGTYHEKAVELFQTASYYQMVHALALIAVGAVSSLGDRRRAAAGWLFAIGVVLFSGSLYALALTSVSVLGAITPFGGTAFLVGWAVFAWSAGGRRAESSDA